MRKPSAPPTAPARGKTPAPAPRTAAPEGGLSESDVRKMPASEYMNAAQLDFFRRRLIAMRNEMLDRERGAKERLHDNEIHADPADRATAEEEHFLDLRLRERELLLRRKIDESLRRIDSREYGYCSETGEPIGIARLLVRPTATVCVDIKDRDEKMVARYVDGQYPGRQNH